MSYNWDVCRQLPLIPKRPHHLLVSPARPAPKDPQVTPAELGRAGGRGSRALAPPIQMIPEAWQVQEAPQEMTAASERLWTLPAPPSQ